MIFRDRIDAGQKLAQLLNAYQKQDAIIYGLPRGGVVVADVISKVLNLPLDLLIARKIGHPANPEYAIGAVSEHGKPILNEHETLAITQDWLAKEIANQRKEARRRRELYLKGQKPLAVKGKIAIIVDDGIATGFTMLAAIAELKAYQPQKIIVAVPVIPFDTYQKLQTLADEVIAIKIDRYFLGAVGAYYQNFSQVEDEEVIEILQQARATS